MKKKKILMPFLWSNASEMIFIAYTFYVDYNSDIRIHKDFHFNAFIPVYLVELLTLTFE